MDYSENLDIFVLENMGLGMGNFSLGTAAGIFKTVVSFIFLFSSGELYSEKNGREQIILKGGLCHAKKEKTSRFLNSEHAGIECLIPYNIIFHGGA